MRTLTEKYLGGMRLDEDMYKVDLASVGLYQTFSSEVLRLSLLGIAGYGFLITTLAVKVTNKANSYLSFESLQSGKAPFLIGAFLLALSAASALAHRHYSTDCMTHYIRRLRVQKKIKEMKESTVDHTDKAKLEEYEKVRKAEVISLDKDVRMCAFLQIIASFLLGGGILCVGITFVLLLK